VFGATGGVGSQVSKALIARKVQFRAAVHTLSKGEELKKKLGGDFEVVAVDSSKSDTVEAALKGIEKVFLVVPSFVPLSFGLGIVSAIKKVGTVKHVVLLSAAGAEDGSQCTVTKEHRQTEEAIRKTGIALTSIRPTCFMDNFFVEAKNIKDKSIYQAGIGEARVNWVSTKDIGEISAISLVEGEKHHGKNYEVTGPEAMTGYDAAKILSDVLGKQITYEPLTIPKLQELASRFMPPTSVKLYGELVTWFSIGGFDRLSGDLQHVTGSKGQSLKEWVQENKTAFT